MPVYNCYDQDAEKIIPRYGWAYIVKTCIYKNTKWDTLMCNMMTELPGEKEAIIVRQVRKDAVKDEEFFKKCINDLGVMIRNEMEKRDLYKEYIILMKDAHKFAQRIQKAVKIILDFIEGNNNQQPYYWPVELYDALDFVTFKMMEI